MLLTLFGVPGKLKKLLDRLTATRAANLDNVLSKLKWTDTKAGYIDTTISSRASDGQANFISNQISDLPQGNQRSTQSGWLFNVPFDLDGGTGLVYRYHTQLIISAVTDISKCRVFVEGSASSSSAGGGRYYQEGLIQFIAHGYLFADNVLLVGVRNTGQFFTGKWTVVEYY